MDICCLVFCRLCFDISCSQWDAPGLIDATQAPLPWENAKVWKLKKWWTRGRQQWATLFLLAQITCRISKPSKRVRVHRHSCVSFAIIAGYEYDTNMITPTMSLNLPVCVIHCRHTDSDLCHPLCHCDINVSVIDRRAHHHRLIVRVGEDVSVIFRFRGFAQAPPMASSD